MKKPQRERVMEVLEDGNPHSTFEIMERLYPSGKAGLFRLGSVIHLLRSRYGHDIKGWHDKDIQSKYWYQLIINHFRQDLFQEHHHETAAV